MWCLDFARHERDGVKPGFNQVCAIVLAMELYFLIAGQALCLFSLWAIARYDWVRLTRASRRIGAVVTGHRSSWSDGSKSFAAIYRFTLGGAEHDVTDAVYGSSPKPPVGTRVELAYPEGRPDLARPPRPLLWLSIYGLLVGLDVVLLAKMMRWIGG